MGGPPAQDGPIREQLSALRSMLVFAMLLTQQDSQASILHYVANAVESMGSCTTEGIFLDGRWQDVRLPGRKTTSLPAVLDAAEGGPGRPGGGRPGLAARRPGPVALPPAPPPGPAGLPPGGAPAPARRERAVPDAGAGP